MSSFEIGSAEIAAMRSLHRANFVSDTFRLVDGVYEPIPTCLSCNGVQTAPCFVLQLCDALENLQYEYDELRLDREWKMVYIQEATARIQNIKKMFESTKEINILALDTVLEDLKTGD